MMGPRQFGFNAFWWEKLSDEESLRKVVSGLSQLGYHYVEYKETSFNPRARMGEELSRAVRITRAGGLEVSNFVILRDISGPEEREKNARDVVSFIEAISESGASVMNMVTGGVPVRAAARPDEWWIPPEPDAQLGWDNLCRSLETILRAAEKFGVTLAIEACQGQIVHDYFTTLELLKRFDSPRLGLTLDPSHYQLYGNDIPWAVRQLAPRIKHVHMKDAAGHPGRFGLDFMFPILGEGAINWSGFFGALEDINYGGALSAEFEAFKYMNEVLHNNFMKAAEMSMQSLTSLWQNYEASKAGGSASPVTRAR